MKKFNELYKQHEEKINSSFLFKRAYQSALYHEKWKNKGINVVDLKGFSGLKQLPFSSADDLRAVWAQYPIEDIILTKNVGLWHCTSGSTGAKKWIPWSYNDYVTGRKIAAQILFQTGLTKEDILLSIVLPSPFISGSIGYRLLEGSGALGSPIEQIILAPTFVQDSFGLLLKRQPTIILSTPSLALRMAEEISKNTPKVLARLAKEKKSMKYKFASFITKVKSIKPKQIFKRLRLGFFASESLAPYRNAVEKQYGIEAFDFYGFTEGFGAGIECREHNGLHFPSLNTILEIIPKKELEKEEKDPDYLPETVLLNEAEKGLEGELVVTDFKEALPLVRYRLRDMVKVISDGECVCGQHNPRLKVLGRTDDIINLGIIRLSVLVIDSLLRNKYQYGALREWSIYVQREGYKPKLTLSVEPEYVKNEEEFKKEIFERLYSFNVFKSGIDNQLFIFDDIKIVSKVELKIIGQGKASRIQYASD
ncbi:MAG: phenylacetate--CoA ligase family protein, partial [Candidatus Odinarchaeia archaeon]